MHISVEPKDPSGMYYPGEPVRFRFVEPPIEGESPKVGFDYRLATLQPVNKPGEFWLVWFLSEYEKPHKFSTGLLMTEEPNSRVFWVGEGRCTAHIGVEGNCTRMDLDVSATSIKNMEEFFGEMKGSGRWLARLLKPGGLAGEIVKIENDYLCYVRLS